MTGADSTPANRADALRTAANAAGDIETARVCDQILEEEQAMARFLADTLPIAVEQVMAEPVGA
ncbi:MAG: DUF892 family protein [Longimicrobiales bacterium]